MSPWMCWQPLPGSGFLVAGLDYGVLFLNSGALGSPAPAFLVLEDLLCYFLTVQHLPQDLLKSLQATLSLF